MTRLNSDHAFEGASRGEVAPEMDAKMGDKGPCARFVHDSLRPDSANGIGVFAPDLPKVDGGEPESESCCPEPLEYSDENDEGDEVIDLPIALQHSSMCADTLSEKAKSCAVQPPLFLMVELLPFSINKVMV